MGTADRAHCRRIAQGFLPSSTGGEELRRWLAVPRRARGRVVPCPTLLGQRGFAEVTSVPRRIGSVATDQVTVSAVSQHEQSQAPSGGVAAEVPSTCKASGSHARTPRDWWAVVPANQRLNLPVRPVTRLALSVAGTGSQGGEQGARPSRP